jgi:phage terminase small subunit
MAGIISAMTGSIRPRGGRLTERQKTFVAEYLVDLNGRQAAIRAGYSPRSATQTASYNLARPVIAEAVAEEQAKRLAVIDMRAEEVLSELAAIARANFLDYMRIDEAGEPVIDLSGLDRTRAAALADVTVESLTTERKIRRVRVKLQDKLGALDRLARHYGLLRGSGSDERADGPAREPVHDPRQAARAVLVLLRESAGAPAARRLPLPEDRATMQKIGED